MRTKFTLLFLSLFFFITQSNAQQSVARIWNETQLSAIRIDAARPPVQARNLFHVSLAMYDAWAVYDANASTYLLGKTINGVNYPFTGVPTPSNIETARRSTVSYAAYRVLQNRYALSPNWATTSIKLDSVMNSLGYSTSFTSVNYSSGDAAALGNYIAQQVIAMGYADGANQVNNYAGTGYSAGNASLTFYNDGNSTMSNVTRWQPLTFVTCIDQNGIPCGTSTPSFICPLWGKVLPFSMPTVSATHQTRSSVDYPLYNNPGAPPILSLTNVNDTMSQYCKWGHEMTAIWSGHLDPNDATMWDISPNAKGNISNYPTTLAGLKTFYNLLQGGPQGPGYTVNPVTGSAYPTQLVKRGDYTRIVSQYWADGPSSETPPGHWFAIINTVSNYPGFVKKIGGVGPLCSNIEWDIKSYFALGAAMHDAAIACWGIKGWYDSPRPISMIRKMVALGQCTNSSLPNYHAGGIDLIPGYIEQITMSDPAALRGAGNVNVNKIKIKAWKGFSSIAYDYSSFPYLPINAAGADWILADKWMPFQRETFVTPPFAGYVSGHSTYSRAAALSLTNLTGSPYFPGGFYEYTIPANSNFIGFELSPTTAIKLQYASYKDASDEASLSRIWGGIHPPFDDMPGRLIGEKIGNETFYKAKSYFENKIMTASISANSDPICSGTSLTISLTGTNIPGNASYTWRKNGVVIATNNMPQYITNSFANNDKYSCEVASSNFKVGSNELTIHTQACSLKALSLKLFLSGYYNQSNAMKPVLLNQNQSSNTHLVDYVKVELHQAIFPYALIEKQVVELNENGNAVVNFSSAAANYYVVIKHRNSIETWSATPLAIGTITAYDFTTMANKAFGSNQMEIEPNVWGIFAGDIDQDGIIDNNDFSLWEADANGFLEGYLSTDLDGNGAVDNNDFSIWEANANGFVSVLKP
jgi:hypothetical protein